MNDFFENAEVIDSYSDAEAIEDGVIVDTGNWFLFCEGKIINRMTQTAIHKICERLNVTIQDGLCAKISELLETARSDDGDFYIDAPFKIWVMPNEANGLTLMLPSDY